MTLPALNPTGKAGVPAAKPVSVVKFSDKLTDSLEDITKMIDTNAQTSKTISNIQSGLKTGDVNKIKGHTGELQELTRALTAILPN